MAETGSTIDAVYQAQVEVGTAVLRLRKSQDANAVAGAERHLAAAVVAVREGGSVVDILEAEQVLLRDELDRFANTPTMKGSLETALEEVDAALATVKVVEDPPAYRDRVDATHRGPS